MFPVSSKGTTLRVGRVSRKLRRGARRARREAERALAALATRERVRLATAPPSLTNDALLAASCLEADVVLVTRNVRDFSRLQGQMRGFRFVAPWP